MRWKLLFLRILRRSVGAAYRSIGLVNVEKVVRLSGDVEGSLQVRLPVQVGLTRSSVVAMLFASHDA
jgi:hypothetical protein